MTWLGVICVAVGGIFYLLTPRLSPSKRVAASAAMALLPLIILFAWLLIVGDSIPDGAVLVAPAP